jgi:2-dehydropantoate 2-reductase
LRIAVMGTGGIGGYLGARLAASGAEVTFIARGPQLRAILERGLRIESLSGPVHIHPARATDDPAKVPPPEIILFCVKLWDVAEAARAMRPMVGENTCVVTLQNGVESRSRVASVIGAKPVIGGVAHISATVLEPGIVRHTGKLQRLTFSELDGKPSPRTQAFLDACTRAKIDARLTERIEEAIWDKFIFLVAFSGMTALTRTGIGPIREQPETFGLFRAAMEEALAVAAAKGIAFAYDPIAQWLKAIAGMPHDFRSSMLEDLERGRRLELPWLSGAVARMGAELAIETPVNRFIAAALQLHANPAGGAGSGA